MEPRQPRRIHPARWFGWPALVALSLIAAAACRAEKPAPPARASLRTESLLSMAVLTPVFGNAEDGRSGLSDFTQSDREIFLSYHLYPADPKEADREIARDLAPKIRRLYGRFPNVNRASFEVSLPEPGLPGNWKPYVSFTLTRKVVKDTGWSDLFDTDLLSAALNVKRTR